MKGNVSNPMAQQSGQNGIAASDSLGVLAREVRVRMINCSLSGCLIESNAALQVGTVAALTVRIGDDEYEDDVRVVRCQPIAGAGALYHIGAQFLWTALPGRTSLRLTMQKRTAVAAQV